jgi:hypothetical protein
MKSLLCCSAVYSVSLQQTNGVVAKCGWQAWLRDALHRHGHRYDIGVATSSSGDLNMNASGTVESDRN